MFTIFVCVAGFLVWWTLVPTLLPSLESLRKQQMHQQDLERAVIEAKQDSAQLVGGKENPRDNVVEEKEEHHDAEHPAMKGEDEQEEAEGGGGKASGVDPRAAASDDLRIEMLFERRTSTQTLSESDSPTPTTNRRNSTNETTTLPLRLGNASKLNDTGTPR